MTSSNPMRNEDIRALDQTRQRLLQLTSAIQTLQTSLQQTEPIPPWSSFQLQVKIISQQIESLSSTLGSHNQLLSRLAVFPLPDFPSRTHEGLLGQLLRKKVEPGIEDWINDGRGAVEAIVLQQDTIGREELDELWDWAPSALQDSFKTYAETFGGNYTLEETAMGTENVRTGLKRELLENVGESDDDDEDEEDDDGDDDDEEEPKDIVRPKANIQVTNQTTPKVLLKPGMSLNDQLKYLVNGTLPASMSAA